jgi:uncharacterized protein (DUF983 family)
MTDPELCFGLSSLHGHEPGSDDRCPECGPDEGWHPFDYSDPLVDRCDVCGVERRLHP